VTESPPGGFLTDWGDRLRGLLFRSPRARINRSWIIFRTALFSWHSGFRWEQPVFDLKPRQPARRYCQCKRGTRKSIPLAPQCEKKYKLNKTAYLTTQIREERKEKEKRNIPGSWSSNIIDSTWHLPQKSWAFWGRHDLPTWAGSYSQ
jgi:hypothetical protein